MKRLMVLLAILSACKSRNYNSTESLAEKNVFQAVGEFEKDLAIGMGSIGYLEVGRENIIKMFEAGMPQLQIYDNSTFANDWLDKDKKELEIARRELTDSATREKVFGKHANKIVYSITNHDDEGRDYKWARDWGPVLMRDGGNQIRFIDFIYSTDSQSNSEFDLTTAISDSLKVENITRIPHRFEGGNFLTDGQGNCFSGSSARSRSSSLSAQPELQPLLTQAANCKSFTVFDGVGETGIFHIDFWIRFVGPKSVLVAKVSDRTREFFKNTPFDNGRRNDPMLNINAAAQLFDRGAAKLTALGYTVIRVPTTMVTGGGATLNGLQFGKNLVLTRWGKSPNPAADSALHSQIEKDGESILRAAGLNVTWVDIPKVIQGNGGLHCVTVHLPIKP